jgi:DNA-binding transcriptional LysR family regulator
MRNRPKITLKQLEIFQAIVVAGSFTKAVNLTELSQPTLSQQLANLEKELQVQLIARGKKSIIELTPAGEFWLARSKELLGHFEASLTTHRDVFVDQGLTVNVGTTPSLQGRFDELIAKAALPIVQIKSLNIKSFLNSRQVSDALMSHRINLAIGSRNPLEEQKHSLVISKLYDDKIVWAVPRDVPTEDVIRTFAEGRNVGGHACFERHVMLMPNPPWYLKTQDWYRSRLPFSMPYFTVSTHQAAVQLAASGAATCHTPMTQIPNLAEGVSSRLRYFEIGELAREVCLAYPKHLQSMSSFIEFAESVGRILRFEQANTGEIQTLDIVERTRLS